VISEALRGYWNFL